MTSVALVPRTLARPNTGPLLLPETGRSPGCPANENWRMLVVEKQQEPESELEGHNAHPVEPAEGAREPGEDANAPRPPHPDQPAEGER